MSVLPAALRRLARLQASDKTMGGIFAAAYTGGKRPAAETLTQDGSVLLTVSEFKQKIDLLATAIINVTGYTDRYIGLYGENTAAWLISFWGILKSGNKPFLINTLQPVSMMQKALSLVDAAAVLYVGCAPRTEVPLLSYDTLMAGETVPLPSAPAFADTFAMSTSGSSLEVKVCVYHGAQIAALLGNSLQAALRNSRTYRSDHGRYKSLLTLPLFHIFGLQGSYFWLCVLGGATAVFSEARSAEGILADVRRAGVTHIFAVPAFWSAAVKLGEKYYAHPEAREKTVSGALAGQAKHPVQGRRAAEKLFFAARAHTFGNSLKLGISGGCGIAEDVLRTINAWGYPLCNGYGSTECGIVSVEFSHRVNDRIADSVGLPFKSAKFTVNDNELTVEATTVCEEILTETGTVYPGGVFVPGDLVTDCGRGRLAVTGRVSELICAANGEKINPDSAAASFSLRFATDFAVLGDADLCGLILLVQVDPNAEDWQKRALSDSINECNRKLPLAYQMKQILFTYAPLADAAALKPNRKLLLQKVRDGSIAVFTSPEGRREHTEADSDIKEILRALFADALGIDAAAVSNDSHFFNDLGGDSLSYYSLVISIDRRFNVQIPFEADSFSYSVDDFEKVISCILKQS